MSYAFFERRDVDIESALPVGFFDSSGTLPVTILGPYLRLEPGAYRITTGTRLLPPATGSTAIIELTMRDIGPSGPESSTNFRDAITFGEADDLNLVFFHSSTLDSELELRFYTDATSGVTGESVWVLIEKLG